MKFFYKNYASIWQEFYNQHKKSNWPECPNEGSVSLLPDEIKNQILTIDNVESYLDIDPTRIIDINLKNLNNHIKSNGNDISNIECNLKFAVAPDFNIYYEENMDGGGTEHGQNYPLILKYLFGKRKTFENCLEWCSGPGFIGFRLLSDQICKHVSMMDIYKPALDACQLTWNKRPSRLENSTMDIVHADKISNIKKNKKYDLVVGNPPNFSYYKEIGRYLMGADGVRIVEDQDLKIHSEFFQNIGNYLSDDGVIVLQKSATGSQPSDHLKDIESGGLKIDKIFIDKQFLSHYYIVLTHNSK